jgi:hypothetical protein
MKDLDDRQARRPVQNITFLILTCILILAIGIFSMNSLASLKKPPATAKKKSVPSRWKRFVPSRLILK